MSVPDWTQYGDEEFAARLAIIVDETQHAYTSQGKLVDVGRLTTDAPSWAYALEQIPTKQLGRAFTRAIQSWSSDYPMGASYVKRVYDEMQKEHREGYGTLTDVTSVGEALRLLSGRYEEQPPKKPMSISEWKEKHGLPKEWKLGDPYPENSDLRAKPYEEPLPSVYEGVWDDRWFRGVKVPWELYPDREHAEHKDVAVRQDVMGPHGYQTVETTRVHYVHWMDRCPEMEHPANICPGYVLEHFGVDGAFTRKHPCPFHKGKAVELAKQENAERR